MKRICWTRVHRGMDSLARSRMRDEEKKKKLEGKEVVVRECNLESMVLDIVPLLVMTKSLLGLGPK